MTSPFRFLLFSHDGMGLGHTRRNLAIADALVTAHAHASVLVASGAEEAIRDGLPPRVEVLGLPGLRKVAQGEYTSRRLPISTAELHALRAGLLRSAVEAFQPEVLLVDRHPFGIKGELEPALEALRAAGGQFVLGLRDILDAPEAIAREWQDGRLAERIAEEFAAVLIYGQPTVFDPVTEYSFPQALIERVHFTGYVVNRNRDNEDWAGWPNANVSLDDRPLVLATAGGGEDGSSLLLAFLAAAADAAWRGVVVAGPRVSEWELDELRCLAATAGIPLHSSLPSLNRLYAAADALVCMGGYNTLAEALREGLPVVCVPRRSFRVEQLMRGRAFERLGLLRVLELDQVTPEVLRRTVDTALKTPRQALRDRAHATLDFSGAAQAAQRLLALAGAPSEVVACDSFSTRNSTRFDSELRRSPWPLPGN